MDLRTWNAEVQAEIDRIKVTERGGNQALLPDAAPVSLNDTTLLQTLGEAHTALTEGNVGEGVFNLMLALTDALSGKQINWEDYSVLKRRIIAAGNHHSFVEGR